MKSYVRKKTHRPFMSLTYGKNYYPWQKLTPRFETVSSQKIHRSVRLAVISDLHCSVYGQNQTELLELLQKGNPDVVVMPGDIMEHANPHSGTDILLKALADSYSCYYTAGNHEYYAQETAQIKKRIASYGICVLAGEQQSLAVNGQQLIISGIDDYSVGSETWLDQLTAVSQPNAAVFSVLLSHRPELIKAYQNAGFDLILSGHAHGGQWRFPFLKNGLFAPGQGLFPKYTGGSYRIGNTTLIVSRGLARNIFPRFGNPPEIMFVTVSPDGIG